jgi:hypothetical protein
MPSSIPRSVPLISGSPLIIADDVGLGNVIEAGLAAQELYSATAC